jgi:hypothetical protein
MALGESLSTIEEIIVRELTRAGEGAAEPALARRIAAAVAAALEENNYAIEGKITQKLQVAGLHV